MRGWRIALRVAFVAALAGLLVANVVVLTAPVPERPYREAPDELYDQAVRSPFRGVRATFAVYRTMRRRLAGKRLTIPQLLRGHIWFLRHFVGLEVEVAEGLVVTAARFRNLRQRASHVANLRTSGRMLEVYFVLKRDADHYVAVVNPDATMVAIIPASLAPAPRTPPPGTPATP